jgi:MYXO-CTERM domain-containing protein
MSKQSLILSGIVSGGLAIAMSSGSASASLLIYEPFDYTAGSDIAGQTNTYSAGNPAWAAAGTATAPVHQVISGSLTAPAGLPPAIGNAGGTMNADNTQLDRIALGADYAANTTLYYSLLLNIPSITGLTVPNTNLNANNDVLVAFNNGSGTGTRPSNWAGELVIRLGSVANTYNLGIRASNTTASTTYWTADLNPGDTHFIVVRYAQGATDSSGTDDSNAIWLNPSSANFGVVEGSVPAPDGSSNGTINASSPSNNFARSLLIGAGIATGAAPNQNNIDEIRVGTTWADVTPVPEPVGLAGVAGLGMLALRRRRA